MDDLKAPFSPNADLQHVPEVKKGYVFTFSPVRWHPYKPKHIQDQINAGRAAKRGRWQQMNEYAGWDNIAVPSIVYPDCEMIPLADHKAALEAARAEERAMFRPMQQAFTLASQVRPPHYETAIMQIEAVLEAALKDSSRHPRGR